MRVRREWLDFGGAASAGVPEGAAGERDGLSDRARERGLAR